MLLLLICLILPVTFGESYNSHLLVGDDPPPSPYPSCFMDGLTWSSEESIDIINKVESLYSCQQLCLDSTRCHYFSWYNEQSISQRHLCFLFENPTSQYSCSRCVSGPQSCTCSGVFSCQFSDGNLIGELPDVVREVFCQEFCAITDGCTFYSWFARDAHPFPNACLLFSSCDGKDFTLANCFSGPPNCTDKEIMTSTIRASTSTTSTTPKSPITTSTTATTTTATSTTATTTTTTSTTATTTTATSNCELPELERGEWFCPPATDSMLCYLECYPGYVPEGDVMIQCIDGSWSSYPTCTQAIAIITGPGTDYVKNTAEVYGEGIHQHLPNLPDNRFYHTIDYVDSTVLLCGGFSTIRSCIRLADNLLGWDSHSTTQHSRFFHGSVVMLNQLYLLGGKDYPQTTELLDPAGGSTWTGGWDLIEYSQRGCAVKVGPQTFITIGGMSHPNSVVSYDARTSPPRATRLMDLRTPRMYHGCAYVRDPLTNYTGVIVAGGDGDAEFDSEIFNIEKGRWSKTGQLQTTKGEGVRLVVLGESILATGGQGMWADLTAVDRFNLTSMQWSAAETMLEKRAFHAVTGVPQSLVTINQN